MQRLSKMRDEKRIDRIMDIIKDTWKQNPDMRFGQLLINMWLIEDTYVTWSTEDDDIEKIILDNANNLRREE